MPLRLLNFLKQILLGDNGRRCKSLPEELVIESILTKLPARTLPKCSSVSKLWYNSILNDSRFSVIHYLQNKNKVHLVFNLLNVWRGYRNSAYFFSLSQQGEKADITSVADMYSDSVSELAGFCDGLVCMKRDSKPKDAYAIMSIISLSRRESLILPYLPPPTAAYINLGNGFGFDSLSQAYKVVMLFISKANNELLCMVTTLGANSWRKIITSTLDISRPLASSPFLGPMVTRVSGMLCRQATFCGGHLFWRIKNEVGNNNDKIEMLLSFDLHSEKIHFIRLPTEGTLTTETNERQHLVVDQLLEFKGYPCIARSERIPLSNNGHCGHRCIYQMGVYCCCCCKVHMYILKDKDKQIWIREETFDVQIKGQKGLPPLCWYFDTSAAMPSTRVLAFSDQVLLYWFNGESLVFYNLQEKHLKVVECSHSHPGIFQMKKYGNINRVIGDDDNIYCPSVDYQLHAQVDNTISLKSFIPKGAETSDFEYADFEVFLKNKVSLKNKLPAGWVITGRKPSIFSAFF